MIFKRFLLHNLIICTHRLCTILQVDKWGPWTFDQALIMRKIQTVFWLSDYFWPLCKGPQKKEKKEKWILRSVYAAFALLPTELHDWKQPCGFFCNRMKKMNAVVYLFNVCLLQIAAQTPPRRFFATHLHPDDIPVSFKTNKTKVSVKALWSMGQVTWLRSHRGIMLLAVPVLLYHKWFSNYTETYMHIRLHHWQSAKQ